MIPDNPNRIPVNRKLLARFFSKVKIDPTVTFQDNPCWLWNAYTSPDGYGRFKLLGKARTAHRAAFNMFVYELSDGYEPDHLCRNPACVNPAHLEDVTKAENSRRANASITHCKQGHPFSPENTKHNGRQRICIACRRKVVRESNHRIRSKTKYR